MWTLSQRLLFSPLFKGNIIEFDIYHSVRNIPCVQRKQEAAGEQKILEVQAWRELGGVPDERTRENDAFLPAESVRTECSRSDSS